MGKRILLFGKDGQVGWELQRALSPLGQLSSHGKKTCDLTNTESLGRIISEYSPDVIVNAAAYTAVDRAENEQETALKINHEAVALIAKMANERNILLVHYSTDYIFDGTKEIAYIEDDIPNPLSAYGTSKWLGERAILDSGCKYLIFRTSWVFAARGKNFVRTILRLASTEEKLRVVSDQWGTPTSAELIADITAHALYNFNAQSNIYHLSASGTTNWFEYAKFIINRSIALGAPIKVSSIESIETAEYYTSAKRPANSQLNCAKLQSDFNIKMPPWQYHVERVLSELIG